MKEERGAKRCVGREAGEFRKLVGEPALFRRDAGLAALQPSFHRGDCLVRPHEAYFELRRRLRIAEIERPESRDAKPHVNVRAAIREFKLRLFKEGELHEVNRSSMSG